MKESKYGPREKPVIKLMVDVTKVWSWFKRRNKKKKRRKQ